MTQVLTIGVLREQNSAERMQFPLLKLPAMSWLQDALGQAVRERRGVAAVGPKGIGKSVALQNAIEAWREAADEARRADASAKPGGILKFLAPRTGSRRDFLEFLWKEATGYNVPTIRGRRIPEDQLLRALVDELQKMEIVALAIDEGENLSTQAALALRDLMSLSEEVERLETEIHPTRPAGLGIVAVGTEILENRIHRVREGGHRWVRLLRLGPLGAEEVAGAYEAFLPGFSKHIRGLKDREWIEFVEEWVCDDGMAPIRLVMNHTRLYVSRMLTVEPTLAELRKVPFNDDVFRYTVGEVLSAVGRPIE